MDEIRKAELIKAGRTKLAVYLEDWFAKDISDATLDKLALLCESGNIPAQAVGGILFSTWQEGWLDELVELLDAQAAVTRAEMHERQIEGISE